MSDSQAFASKYEFTRQGDRKYNFHALALAYGDYRQHGKKSHYYTQADANIKKALETENTYTLNK